MHAIIAEKARPSAIPEGEAVEGAKDSRSKKELSITRISPVISSSEKLFSTTLLPNSLVYLTWF